MTSRVDQVLALLNGESIEQSLCFSGLINVTRPGLDELGLKLAEVHHDAEKMAAAAASTHRMFDLGSAVVPLDMCIEAELLGASVVFAPGGEKPELPRIVDPLVESATALTLQVPDGLADRGRIPVVCEAIQILKGEFGDELAIGAVVPGPFTVASWLVNIGGLLMETRTDPGSVADLLDGLTDLLITVAGSYHEAGADFLTVHEMGGSPGFIGPPAFEQLVLPRLQRLIAALPEPTVLHVCGRTNMAMEMLAAAGAAALSVDQLNDLSQSRADLGDGQVLLGNIDPVGVLGDGTAQDVASAVVAAVESGVSAIWPGCDLRPDMPRENLIAMVEETRRHQRPPQPKDGSSH
jgi:[methyl-Co(III) methanol-specific corrinoid protein]:coenzyme M methyltransferase